MTTDHGAEEAARHGQVRSEHWPGVERAFRAANPRCLACRDGAPTAGNEQVHHRVPFHYVKDPRVGRPDLELDPRNLVTLCETEAGKPGENHHLDIGHLGAFKEGNLLVREDATGRYHGLTNAQIRGDPDWRTEERDGRLRPLDLMTAADFAALRARCDQEMPPDPALLARYGLTVTPP